MCRLLSFRHVADIQLYWCQGRYLRKAIIPAQQQPLPLGLCTFKISHDQKPAGRSPAPVTCCLQILRNRVYHGLRCYLISAQNQHHHLGYSLQSLPADDGGGFGMQHFHPGLRLSQLSDVPLMPGQQRRKSGRGVIKQTTFQPAHILSLLCVDTTNTL